MEIIEVKGLEFYAYHGVADQERVLGNMFRVDVRLTVNLADAMKSDDIADTLNYAIVADIVKREMGVPSRLLENVAWRIRRAVTERFDCIVAGCVKVAKLTPPIPYNVEEVSVTTSWPDLEPSSRL